MKLRRIRVKNFLSFGEEPAKIDFGDSAIAFIVGPNNSGKSNIFRTLNFVADSISTWRPVESPASYLHPGRRDFEISVEVERARAWRGSSGRSSVTTGRR